MESAFLSALKARSESIKASRSDKPESGKTYALTGNGGANIANGKSWQDSEVKPELPKPVILQQVTIDLVLNRQRIDVFFKLMPDRDTLDWLHDNGFRYRREDRGWYHQDNPGNRAKLKARFNATFIDSGEVTPEVKPVQIVEPEKPAEDADLRDNDMTPFGCYKRQCRALCEHLKIDMADLALLAIAKLYERTFE
jgi:hypothetical protein